MFDNVAFEVVTGLVLIYLLYSLLITILGEVVATRLGIRARLLRVAVERMLNDGYYQKIESNKGKKWQGWLRKSFLFEPSEFPQSFAGKFYEYPAIKYLSRIEDNYQGAFSSSKPSYMSPDYFADALIAFLMDKGDGVTDMDRVRFTLRYNTYNIQPKTLKQFRNLFENAGNNKSVYKANLIKWFSETMDRANGWHKRKMRIISFALGLLVAIIFNINTIHIAQILSNDKQARDALVKMGIELAKDSSRYQTYISENGDSVRTNAIIDTSFARIQKDIHAATFIMGLGWNTDTLTLQDSIVIEKSKNPGSYQLLADGKDYFNNLRKTETLAKTGIRTKSRDIALIRDSLKMYIPDSLYLATLITQAASDSVAASLKKQQAALEAHAKDLEKRLELTKQLLSRDSVIYNRALQLITEQQQLMLPAIGNRYIQVDRVLPGAEPEMIVVHGGRKFTFWQSVKYVLNMVLFKYGWIGLVLTAIALSMGAPFWFDLLNKLVSVRGVGVKPEEKKAAAPLPESLPAAVEAGQPEKVYTSDPVEYALYLHRDQLEAIPGVLAVNYEYRNINEKKISCIEVSVTGVCDTGKIPEKYDVTLNNQPYAVPVFVTQTPAATLHMSLNAKIPALGVQNNVNRDSETGWGTVTGIVLNRKTKKKAILSCSHILRGHYNEVEDDKQRVINDHAGTTIASLYYYVHSNTLDVAYADTTKKEITGYPEITAYQEVVRLDAEMETEVIMDGFVSGRQEGKIINNRTQFPFAVNGRLVTMVNLVKIIRRAGDKHACISTYGDSGALISRKQDNMPLAMIIGGTEEFSLAITLKEVFESLYIEPLKEKV